MEEQNQNQQQDFNGSTPPTPPVQNEGGNNGSQGQYQHPYNQPQGQPQYQQQGYNQGQAQYQQQPYNQGQPQYQQPPQQNIYVNNTERKSNGMGTAGMVLAIIGLFTSMIPVVGWIFWVLGLIFSIIGIFKEPRGMAIAGLVISLIGFLILVVFVGALFSAVALSM